MANSPFKIPDELVNLRKRVAAIFLPHAMRRLKDLGWDAGHAARFVHYTSASAAIGIIENKSIWMRNSMCMVDYREISHGYELLSPIFDKQEIRDGFVQALDACTPGVAGEAFAGFNNAWGRLQRDTYITCLSEHLATEDEHGRLSMWRAFAPTTARVAMVFSFPELVSASESLSIIISPVGYLSAKEVEEEVRAVTKNIRENSDFLATVDRQIVLSYAFSMLISAVLSLKHTSFREELEWRAIYLPSIHPSALMTSSVKVIGDVPQRIYEIPLDAKKSAAIADLDFAKIFDRLIIGPTQFGVPMVDAFVSKLSAAGVSDAGNRVWLSSIPLRT